MTITVTLSSIAVAEDGAALVEEIGAEALIHVGSSTPVSVTVTIAICFG